ncbi:hypothetical protein ACMFMG_004451 [Clarireedia jacksonii]
MSPKIKFAFLSTVSIALLAGSSLAQSSTPNTDYISKMCYPLYTNNTRFHDLDLTFEERIPSLANSPFPCEQKFYISQVCSANGTTPIDFLAEQECLCPSSYWVALSACDDCYLAHGYLNQTKDEMSAEISSLSSAECLATSPPIQPFLNLWYTSVDISSLRNPPDVAIGTDKFPNQTAVSNYFTSTGTNLWTTGAITGSATARLTSFTNTDDVRFTPTATIASSRSGSATSAAAASAKSSSPAKRLEGTRLNALMGVLGMVLLF